MIDKKALLTDYMTDRLRQPEADARRTLRALLCYELDSQNPTMPHAAFRETIDRLEASIVKMAEMEHVDPRDQVYACVSTECRIAYPYWREHGEKSSRHECRMCGQPLYLTTLTPRARQA